MTIPTRDREILRRLAETWAETAADPANAQRADLWRRVNRLERVKPVVWINEIPWHEMNIDDELTLRCSDPWCRGHEQTMRRTLYQWRHMPADMTIEPVYYVPLVIEDSGFGIGERVDVAHTDTASGAVTHVANANVESEAGLIKLGGLGIDMLPGGTPTTIGEGIVSRHFYEQIDSLADLNKIKMPTVTHDAEASASHLDVLRSAIGDILPVELRGEPGFWFAPWDELIRWWGVEKAMQDLVLRPELVHAAMERLTDAYLTRLDQYEAQGLLALNNTNVRIGSGGYGYTDELPGDDFDPAHVRTADLWGCGTAQIFGAVSPRMHEEFALRYERRWMERFALNYYGCCEPLHLKVDMLRGVPGMRKLSMSPWVDIDVAARELGTEFVFSRKPNPAILAGDGWNPDAARELLVDDLERTRGCVVEVIMKDISTVRWEPQRLWAWSRMADEITASYA